MTWQRPKTWSYSVADFEDVQELATPLKDGWGITSDGSHLIVGDSTDKLTWLDPADVSRAVREVTVKGEGAASGQGRGMGRAHESPAEEQRATPDSCELRRPMRAPAGRRPAVAS